MPAGPRRLWYSVRARLRGWLVCGRRRDVVYELPCRLVVGRRDVVFLHAVPSDERVGRHCGDVGIHVRRVRGGLFLSSGRVRLHAVVRDANAIGLKHARELELVDAHSNAVAHADCVSNADADVDADRDAIDRAVRSGRDVCGGRVPAVRRGLCEGCRWQRAMQPLRGGHVPALHAWRDVPRVQRWDFLAAGRGGVRALRTWDIRCSAGLALFRVPRGLLRSELGRDGVCAVRFGFVRGRGERRVYSVRAGFCPARGGRRVVPRVRGRLLGGVDGAVELHALPGRGVEQRGFHALRQVSCGELFARIGLSVYALRGVDFRGDGRRNGVFDVPRGFDVARGWCNELCTLRRGHGGQQRVLLCLCARIRNRDDGCDGMQGLPCEFLRLEPQLDSVHGVPERHELTVGECVVHRCIVVAVNDAVGYADSEPERHRHPYCYSDAICVALSGSVPVGHVDSTIDALRYNITRWHAAANEFAVSDALGRGLLRTWLRGNR